MHLQQLRLITSTTSTDAIPLPTFYANDANNLNRVLAFRFRWTIYTVNFLIGNSGAHVMWP